ncbi:wax ester/triacylglycerol synthase domain-containing protein [Cryobacterium arcticum]|uniref:diacylglycerol O-acyltransferase n=1 Tax=Cryobacterium arcticum TaxID=670052 RepID=A0A1B1BLQ1_9MICO|nr:wax ester/triacylglycerol synthase domain-containing protein [Cryobacterium arcticum]ANP73458.1 hypothetical protein PA27867_2510 [Cryobacterium arcticum]
MRTPPSIDRVSADDLMSLVAEHGSTPMQVGAVLLLDTRPGLDATRLVRELGRRVAGIPRLRQRLATVPVGFGRPIWVDDPGFDIARHVTVTEVSDPLAEHEVLDIAATLLSTPLPRSRPLWTATLVVTPGGTEAALIVVFHHVLADGIGGLAVLAGLVDGTHGDGSPAPIAPFPRPRPSAGQIAADMLRLRLRALRRVPRDLLRLAAAARQLRLVGASRVARTSLNVPTGARRRFLDIRVGLPQTLAAARARQATVNDVLLVAIAGALHTLLLSRGELVDEFVVSVPFSARLQASAGQLGNASGVIPLRIPAVGDRDERLRRVAALTRTAKRTARGASTALIGPLFRLLARLGLYRWFIDGQRLIHTFTSNVRGPAEPLTLVGCPITALLPLSAATGNVSVAFVALSYAGTLVITIVADPDACPDLQALREALVTELAALGITATGEVKPA